MRRAEGQEEREKVPVEGVYPVKVEQERQESQGNGT